MSIKTENAAGLKLQLSILELKQSELLHMLNGGFNTELYRAYNIVCYKIEVITNRIEGCFTDPAGQFEHQIL